jgi:hypothetical protein
LRRLTSEPTWNPDSNSWMHIINEKTSNPGSARMQQMPGANRSESCDVSPRNQLGIQTPTPECTW